MNSFGNTIRVSLFGESHGEAVGVTIDGFPAGFSIDFSAVDETLVLRKGKASYNTQRNEPDLYRILSGIRNNTTQGTPICAVFDNKDARRSDYDGILRPSHADFPAFVKYNGFADLSGGGHFSARLTAPLVFAGELCRQVLKQRFGVSVGAHIAEIGGICDEMFDSVNVSEDTFNKTERDFPLIDKTKREVMESALSAARGAGDSLGGVVELAAINLPIGVGEPFFDSVESVLAHMLFSVPAVKGVEFGTGFAYANMTGSAANDCFSPDFSLEKINTHNKLKIAQTNNAGGINGGMTNSMPVICRVAFKPIASIRIAQRAIDSRDMTPVIVTTEGRHDVCAVTRGIHAVVSAACIVFLDLLLRKGERA